MMPASCARWSATISRMRGLTGTGRVYRELRDPLRGSGDRSAELPCPVTGGLPIRGRVRVSHDRAARGGWPADPGPRAGRDLFSGDRLESEADGAALLLLVVAGCRDQFDLVLAGVDLEVKQLAARGVERAERDRLQVVWVGADVGLNPLGQQGQAPAAGLASEFPGLQLAGQRVFERHLGLGLAADRCLAPVAARVNA